MSAGTAAGGSRASTRSPSGGLARVGGVLQHYGTLGCEASDRLLAEVLVAPVPLEPNVGGSIRAVRHRRF